MLRAFSFGLRTCDRRRSTRRTTMSWPLSTRRSVAKPRQSHHALRPTAWDRLAVGLHGNEI